jgi:hypothetical protein
MPWPHIIRIWVAKREIKPVVAWMKHFLMPKMPLTDDGRCVATGFEHFTNGLFIGRNTVFGVWSESAMDADTVWVATSEQPRTACATHGLC